MTFASAQLYLRDIQIFGGMTICGNRSDVENWKVRSVTNVREPTRESSFRLGLCLLPYPVALSRAADRHDRLLFNYHRDYMAEEFVENPQQTRQSAARDIEVASTADVETIRVHG